MLYFIHAEAHSDNKNVQAGPMERERKKNDTNVRKQQFQAAKREREKKPMCKHKTRK